MAQTITTDGDGERLGEGVERVWGPLPLERTAEFGAHAPVCSFVVRPRLGVCLLEAVERDVIGDASTCPRRDARDAPETTGAMHRFRQPQNRLPEENSHWKLQVPERHCGEGRRPGK